MLNFISSKIFAMGNAGGHLRTNESAPCVSGASGPGLTSNSLKTKHGSTPLGDFATVICSYDTTAGYSSNSLSSYFNDIGWRDRENSLVNSWLGSVAVSGVESQSLGGNYGEATPSDLGFDFTQSNGGNCTANKDKTTTVYQNHISAVSAVEMARRLILNREIDDAFKFPGMTWEDTKVILKALDSILSYSI